MPSANPFFASSRLVRAFAGETVGYVPKLGMVPVGEIDQRDTRDTLAPIWHSKADTAREAMNRLGLCLKHTAALGLDVDLQATEKARALLGRLGHTVQHVPALPWQDVPSFYQSLSGGTTTELALRLLVLTAVRSYPLRFQNLDQVEGDVWTIPEEAMKGRKNATSEFWVPLSTEAQSVTHEVAETALGHVTGATVERAYWRTDFLEQRRALMERWACHNVGRLGAVVKIATNDR